MKTKETDAVDRVIGGNVRRLRNLNGISQEKLGHLLGLTFQQVQKYEKGTNRISGSRMVQICRGLGATLDDLFYGVDVATGKLARVDPTRRLAELPGGLELAASVLLLPPEVQRAVGTLCRALAQAGTRDAALALLPKARQRAQPAPAQQ